MKRIITTFFRNVLLKVLGSNFNELKKQNEDLHKELGVLTQGNKIFAQKLKEFEHFLGIFSEDNGEFDTELRRLKNLLTPAKVARIKDKNIFLFPEKDLTIRFDSRNNGNMDHATFHVSIPIDGLSKHSVSHSYYYGSDDAHDATPTDNQLAKPFTDALWATKVVTHFSIGSFEIRLSKTATSTWEDVVTVIAEAIASCFPVKENSAE